MVARGRQFAGAVLTPPRSGHDVLLGRGDHRGLFFDRCGAGASGRKRLPAGHLPDWQRSELGQAHSAGISRRDAGACCKVRLIALQPGLVRVFLKPLAYLLATPRPLSTSSNCCSFSHSPRR